MQIGIKTGPRSWAASKQTIEELDIKFLELWYRYDWEEKYQDYFDYFNRRGISFGLHYWGVVENNILPSFCHHEELQYRQGIDSVKQTIDVAAKHGASYVNIHPGSRVLTKLDDNFLELELIPGSPTPTELATDRLLTAVREMDAYAKQSNILFLTETIPFRDAASWKTETGRLETIETHHTSMAMIAELANNGFFIANDLGHSAASVYSQDREEMWHRLYEASKNLAPQTKLLHVNTVSEPFNGTDSHDGILQEDWNNDVFPNEAQLIELLKLYSDRQDIWAIPEPKEGLMKQNYLALQHYAIDLNLIEGAS